MIQGHFDKVLSLGVACETAHQIRRNFPQQQESYFFDWLGTSKNALISILKSDFKDFIVDGAFKPTRDPSPGEKYQHVIHNTYGISLRHHFPVGAPIADGIRPNREKFSYLLDRQRELLTSGSRILFVRRDKDTNTGYKVAAGDRAAFIDQVAAELSRLYPKLDFQLLHVVETTNGAQSEDPRTAQAIMPFNGQWAGDDAAWDNVLAPIRAARLESV